MVASVLTSPKIPAATERAHLLQSNPFCDQPFVLKMARAHRKGKRFADMNAVALKDGQGCAHWAEGPAKNGYRYIVDPHTHRRRPMTHAELHRPCDQWTEAEFVRWRKTAHVYSSPVAQRHMRAYTVAEMQAKAKRLGVVICWELKSRVFKEAARAERFAQVLVDSGHLAYVMTLVTMKDWGEKLQAFSRAGAQTALLAHGQPKPKNLAEWTPWIDSIWGNWRHA